MATRTACPRVALVCDDLPVAGFSGHTTYLNAFLRFLQVRDAAYLLVITGPLFPQPLFNVRRLLGVAGERVACAHALRVGDWFVARSPRAWASSLLRWLASLGPRWLARLVRRLRAASGRGALPIGRNLTRAEAERLAPALRAFQPQAVLVDALFRGAIVEHLDPSCRKLLITHDVMHQRCESIRHSGGAPTPWVSAERERHVLEAFDVAIAITERDAQAFRLLSAKPQVVTIMAPVDVPIATRDRRAHAQACNHNHVLYLASGGAVNEQGIAWFLERIWPTVIARRPELVLEVVGNICNAIPDNAPNVVKHGRVADFSNIAAQAGFAVNPVLSGSGLKIKMLDYFAHGLPCITTSVGAAGFPNAQPSPIAVCDDPARFAEAILRWAEATDFTRHLSDCAREYAQRFSTEAVFAQLDSVLAEPINTRKEDESAPAC